MVSNELMTAYTLETSTQMKLSSLKEDGFIFSIIPEFLHKSGNTPNDRNINLCGKPVVILGEALYFHCMTCLGKNRVICAIKIK